MTDEQVLILIFFSTTSARAGAAGTCATDGVILMVTGVHALAFALAFSLAIALTSTITLTEACVVACAGVGARAEFEQT